VRLFDFVLRGVTRNAQGLIQIFSHKQGIFEKGNTCDSAEGSLKRHLEAVNLANSFLRG
jgi:hypothetical protein